MLKLIAYLAFFLMSLSVIGCSSEDSLGQIVYVSGFGGDAEIALISADGANRRQLTFNAHGDTDPAFSPDGKQIVFSSSRNYLVHDLYDLYVMDIDGSNLRQLTDMPRRSDRHPSWSPDGDKIIFQRMNGDQSTPYLINADGSGVTRCGNSLFEVRTPTWSPDGDTIAFSTSTFGREDYEIWTMDTSCNFSSLKQLTRNDSFVTGLGSWSLDGRKIAYFASNNDSLVEIAGREHGSGPADIFVADADGSNAEQLTTNSIWEISPIFISNDNQIVFSANDEDKKPQLFIMDIDGSNLLKLTSGDWNHLPSYSSR